MKQRNLIIIFGFLALVLALVFLFLKPTYSERKITDSTPLVDPFKSLMNPSESENILKAANQAFTVVENSSLKNDNKRPKFNILSWKVESYEHLGTKGSLILTFFNEQLMSTRFYPADSMLYSKTLSEKYGFDLKTGATNEVPPKTRLQYNIDLNDKYFIEWQDEELQDQVDEWVKNYS